MPWQNSMDTLVRSKASSTLITAKLTVDQCRFQWAIQLLQGATKHARLELELNPKASHWPLKVRCP